MKPMNIKFFETIWEFLMNFKFIKGISIGVLSAISIGFISPLNAQSSSISVSGKYGCMVNKNFAGFDARLDGSTRVGYHYMLHFDLTSKTSQIISIHLIDNYGKNNATTNWAPGASGTPAGNGSGILEVRENPNFPGAFLIRSTTTGENNTKWTTTYVAMSVNNGNTLLISSGAGGNADSEPFTGVCQKI